MDSEKPTRKYYNNLGKEGQCPVEDRAEGMEEVGEGKIRRTDEWIKEAGLKLARF